MAPATPGAVPWRCASSPFAAVCSISRSKSADRIANREINSTIALALISFGAWAIIVIKFAGPKLIIKDLFGNKADKAETPGWLYPVLSLVFLVVGLIEVFSIAIRPFTLSVRLFGNVFGGENLLHGTGFFFYRTPRFNANEWEKMLKEVFVIDTSPFPSETSVDSDLILPDHTYLERLQDALEDEGVDGVRDRPRPASR